MLVQREVDDDDDDKMIGLEYSWHYYSWHSRLHYILITPL